MVSGVNEEHHNGYMQPKYFKGLQIIRTIAFLCIFFFHVNVFHEAFSRWSITVFLMLSGFLNVLHGYEKEISCTPGSLIRYAFRKIRGIYPLHIIMTFIAFALYLLSFGSGAVEHLRSNAATIISKLATNILLISDWGPKNGAWYGIFSEYNIVSWYLSLSLILFILTPVFMKIMHRIYDNADKVGSKEKLSTAHLIKAIVVMGTIYAITIVINVLFQRTNPDYIAFLYEYENPLSRVGDYLISMQMGYLFIAYNKGLCIRTNGQDDGRVIGIWFIISIVSFAASIALLATGIGLYGTEIYWIVSSGFYFTIPIAVMIYAIARSEGICDKLYSNGFGQRAIDIFLILAGLSQYAYLIHVPVINLIHGVYKRVGDVNPAIWCVLSFVVTMAAAIVVKRIKSSKKTICNTH
jgi:peptidoglycan/LPS O-acetylase OafA/YrhL